VYKKQKPVYYPLFIMPIGPKQKPGKYLQAEVKSMRGDYSAAMIIFYISVMNEVLQQSSNKHA